MPKSYKLRVVLAIVGVNNDFRFRGFWSVELVTELRVAGTLVFPVRSKFIIVVLFLSCLMSRNYEIV